MKKYRGKYGFTIAEVLIVLLVLTLIFAAFAPIITKRREAKSRFNVWNWTDKTNELSAYFDKGSVSKPGVAFFGITPTNTATNEFLPYSKVIVRANPWSSSRVQKQFHFRYGYPEDNIVEGDEGSSTYKKLGYDAGSWLMDTKNILIGGSYPYLDSNYKDYDSDKYIYNNLALGINAMNNITNYVSLSYPANKNNIAIGYMAANEVSNVVKDMYIGSFSGYNVNSSNKKIDYNTAIGYMSGTDVLANKDIETTKEKNTNIGYMAGSTISVQENSSSEEYYFDQNNIFIGAYAGTSTNYISNAHYKTYNIGIGYGALPLQYHAVNNFGRYNIAVGYNALGNLVVGENNVAIGYNACSQLVYSSNKICIGANSGPKKNISSKNAYPENQDIVSYNSGKIVVNMPPAYSENDRKQREDGQSYANSYLRDVTYHDDEERIYIGGTPYNYGGDAVLEIHNVKEKNDYLINDPVIKSNVTTIINGNLIVNGRTFFTSGNKLFNMYNYSTDRASTLNLSKDTFWGGGNKDIPCALDGPFTYKFNSHCPSLIYSTNTPLGFDTSSDRRLKHIGKKFTSGLEKVIQLDVKNYIFKDDEKKTPQTGVIAQHLQKIFPNSVFKDENGYLSIKLDEMFYSAINALKELDKKLAALVKNISKVEEKITKLEKENTILQAQVDNLENRIAKIKNQKGL